jgi:hypothetical protein
VVEHDFEGVHAVLLAGVPLDRINLRLAADTFAEIDAACAARPGHVSRNTWIAEAVQEKLAREP